MITFPIPKQLATDPVFYEGFLNTSHIAKLQTQLKEIDFESAMIVGENNSQVNQKEIRESNIKWIPPSNNWEWLYDLLIESVYTANQSFYNFSIDYSKEYIQFTEYDYSYKGHYTWHMDMGSIHQTIRKLSLVIQLSNPEGYEGGELEICNGNLKKPITAPKTQGSLTIFPSYLLHRVTPVTKGTRRSLVWWVGGSQLR